MAQCIRGLNRDLTLSGLVAVALMALLQPAAASEGDRRDRTRFYGIVETMPDELHGVWVIGGQDVTPWSRTEFDEADGPLRVGGCAKVDIRQGRVHEIDSEPIEDCRRAER